MAASSLLSSNLIFSNPKTNLSSLLLSQQFSKSPFSCSSSVLSISLRKGKRNELSFVSRVAVTSEYEQDEEVSGGDEGQSFSPDLKLFVGNLPFSVGSSDLAELFDYAGTVQMVEVIYDKETGRSRGFGFVTMSTAEEVEVAAQQFNGYEFQGRTLRVNYGPPPPREERAPRSFRSGGGGGGNAANFEAGSRLYVGNLSWGVDNLALETLFSEQGKVMDARVVIDRDSGRSRGFGFVTYSSADEANNAISSLNGSDLDGRTIRVSIAEARPPRREF